MERKARGILKDGRVYDCMFELPPGIDETVKTNAKLSDTIKMLPAKVKEYHYQAKRIAAALRDIDGDVRKTCENIWKFLYNHIAYTPDQTGKEQVRSVWRLWFDKIGDCDCYSFFTSCVLSVLGVAHKFKVTAYEPPNYEKGTGGFQHIYVVVPHNGKEIVIDAVLPDFNKEYPYIDKIEKVMDLQFLNGLDPERISLNGGMSFDAQELLSSQLPFTDESVGALKDFVNKAKEKVQNVTQNIKEDVKKVTQNIKQDIKTAGAGVKQTVKNVGPVIKTAVHVINKVNPTTAALRLGILASMKLNLFGVAGQLRYAYLSDAEAQKRGMNMKRFARYKKVREKLEKIFFNAGGKPENLKDSILTGKGNQDKNVTLSGFALRGLGYNNSSSLRDIIGADLYHDEITGDTLNGLGEPITAATVTAASGILATIAGIIKNIGDLFKGGEPGPDAELDALDKQGDGASEPKDEEPSDYSNDKYNGGSSDTESPETDSGGGDDNGSQSGSGDPPPGPSTGSFFDDAKAWAVKNKTPLIATGIALGVGVTAYVLYRKFGGKKKEKGERAKSSHSETTQGVPRGTSSRTLKSGSKNEKILRELRLSRLK